MNTRSQKNAIKQFQVKVVLAWVSSGEKAKEHGVLIRHRPPNG